jgi:hypothetical protein
MHFFIVFNHIVKTGLEKMRGVTSQYCDKTTEQFETAVNKKHAICE